MKINVFNVMGVLSLVCGFLLVGIVLYWSIFPLKVAEYTNLPFPVLNEEPLTYGDSVRFNIDICKYHAYSAKVTRAFEDGITYVLPVVYDNRPAIGCYEFISGSVIVPKYLPAGEYYVRIVAEYKVNPIRTVTIEGRTETFEVVESN